MFLTGRQFRKLFASFKPKGNIMKLHLISASIVAYALLAAAWICQADLVSLY